MIEEEQLTEEVKWFEVAVAAGTWSHPMTTSATNRMQVPFTALSIYTVAKLTARLR